MLEKVFELVGNVLSRYLPRRMFEFVFRLFVGRRMITDSTFVQYFERVYQPSHPDFIDASRVVALRRASEQFKFLLVYLHSPYHYNTDRFCRQVLGNERLVQYVNENFVCWGGDTTALEAFQIQDVYGVRDFPCMLVLGTLSQSQRPTLIHVIEGFKTADEIREILKNVLETRGIELTAARLEREDRENERRLMREQELEYQEALRQAQMKEMEEQQQREQEERERQHQLEEEERVRREEEQKEMEAQLAEERRLEEKAQKRAGFPAEPEAGTPNTTVIAIRMPNNHRSTRRFLTSDTLQLVMEFCDISDDAVEVDKCDLVSSFPRKVYSDLTLSIAEAGLAGASLHLEEKFEPTTD